MASFAEHILQAKSNLSFLTEVNSKFEDRWDWQVTICFYVGVHLINAYLADKADLHYRTHGDSKMAINPHNPSAIYKLPEDIYLAYTKLEGLSRRSRYLCHEDVVRKEAGQHLTHDKHFAKAIKNLDKLLVHFKNHYVLDFGSPEIACLDLNNNSPLTIFKVTQK